MPYGDRFPAPALAALRHAALIGLAVLGAAEIARADASLPEPQAGQSGGAAQDGTAPDGTPPDGPTAGDASPAGPVLYGYDIVRQTTDDQPHWFAPLNTVTPLLKEFVMYGEALQTAPNGANVNMINGGMPGVGIHLIPDYYNEIFIGTPTEEVRSRVSPASGFTDLPFFLLKTRLLSANEENGDYVVSLYIAGQAPLGTPAFTNDAYYITPTLGMGKGWGDFNIQGTIGTPLPLSHYEQLGGQLATNVAFQYHVLEYFWTELELNNTYWFNGPRGGFDQLFISPNIAFGPVPIPGTITKATLIIGYQTAVTPDPKLLSPLTPIYRHAWQFGFRVFF